MRSTQLAAWLAVSFAAFGQDRLTLDEAISLALKQNRQIQVAQLEVRKSEEAIAAARTFRRPQFKFDLAELQLLSHVNFLFPTGAFGVFPQTGPIPPGPDLIGTPLRPATIVYGEINQPISQLYRIGLGIEILETNRQLAQETYRLQEQMIVNDIKKSYYDLLQTQSALEATQEAIRAFQELERVAEEAVKEQAVLRSDLMDAQLGLAKLEADAVTLGNTSATLKEKINSLIGRDELIDFITVNVSGEEVSQMDLAAARAKAMQQRPELREARLKIEQAEIDRRVKKSEYIPDVSLTVLYLSPFNIEVVPKNMAGAGLTLSWDVFDWGRKKHELEAKTITIEQAKTGAHEAESQVLLEVGDKFRKFQEAKAKLRVAELARDSAIEKLRVATNQYSDRAVQLKDLLQQQASMAEAQYKHRESLLAFWTARADLERTIGER